MVKLLQRISTWFESFLDGSAAQSFLDTLRLNTYLCEKLLSSSNAEIAVCVPQSSSLAASLDVGDVMAHCLLPTDVPGQYASLSGQYVEIVGNELVSKAHGSLPSRRVLILTVEVVEDPSTFLGLPVTQTPVKTITLIHTSRPLVGGLELDGSEELNHATLGKYVAALRSLPEMEVAFNQADLFAKELVVLGIRMPDAMRNIKPSLSACVRGQWSQCLRAVPRDCGFGTDVHEQRELISQVLESYINERIHVITYPCVVQQCKDINDIFCDLLQELRYRSHADFGIQEDFQCPMTETVTAIRHLSVEVTPIGKLLRMKEAVTAVHSAVQHHINSHSLDEEGELQLATDDVVMCLVFAIVSAYPQSGSLLTDLTFIKSFHVCDTSASPLGFALNTFEVALDWLLGKVGFQIEDSPEQGVTFVYRDSSVEGKEAGTLESKVDLPGMLADEACATNEAAITGNVSPKRGKCKNGAWRNTWESVKMSGDAAGSEGFLDVVSNGSTCVAAVSYAGTVGCKKISDGKEGSKALFRLFDSLYPHQTIVQVACGGTQVLAVTSGNEVVSWESPSVEENSTPGVRVRLQLESGELVLAKQVACGTSHCLALSVEGKVWSWGSSRCGKLGRYVVPCLGDSASLQMDESHVAKPQQITDVDWSGGSVDMRGGVLLRRGEDRVVGVKAIFAAYDRSFAISETGSLFSWGCGQHGCLGLGSSADIHVPTQVRALASDRLSITSVSCGSHHTLFHNNTGAVFACGAGSDLKNGRRKRCRTVSQDGCSLVPLPITGLPSVKAITAGGILSAALGSDNTVYVWERTGLSDNSKIHMYGQSADACRITCAGRHVFTVGQRERQLKTMYIPQFS